MSTVCIRCGKRLESDDIGAHRKLVNRGATEYMCVACLAEHFGLSEECIRRKIEDFRAAGCLLFAPKDTQRTAEEEKT